MITNLRFAHKIILANSLVVSIAFATFASFNSYLQKESIRSSLEASLTEVGRLTAENISYWLDARVKLVDAAAQSIQRDSSAPTLQAVLEQKVFKEVFDKIYYGQETHQFTIRPIQAMPTDYNPSSRPWYQAAAKAGYTVLTPPYMFSTTGNIGVTVAAPLIHSSKLEGVLAGDLTLTTLVSIITSLNAGGLGDALLVDENGKVLVSPRPDEVFKKLSDVFPKSTPTVAPGLSNTE